MSKKPKKPHSVVNIVIKQALVDEEMVPLIKWLNSFDSVHTLFCCQGEDGQNLDIVDKPYILWTCTDTLDFIYIIDKFGWHGKTQIIWNSDKRHIEYHTIFHNKKALKWLQIV